MDDPADGLYDLSYDQIEAGIVAGSARPESMASLRS